MSLSGIVKKIFSPGPSGVDLLDSPRTSIAHIEFTTRCNLKCVFCFASQPEYKGTDLDEGAIEDIIETLKARAPRVISVNGHGETTIYKNWNVYCDRMLEAGMPLHIISNFARQFSQAEIKTLSRFKSIEISCDSSDPGLFRELRRGADLKNLALNILRVRGAALKEKKESPDISLSCVVSDRNVLDLVDYVSFGKALGVDHFNFCNLTKYPDLPDTVNPRHITEMPKDQMEKAEASIAKAFEFLKDSGTRFHVQQGLLDSFRQKLNELRTSSHLPTVGAVERETVDTENKEEPQAVTEAAPVIENDISKENGNIQGDHGPQRYASDRPASQTRDCLDPWEFILVQSNRDVLPCCWHKPIHSLGVNQSLSEVFNNTRIRDLRRRLLTGDLSPDCLTCPSRGWTSMANLKKKVWRFLNPGIHKFLSPGIPEIKPGILKDYPVTYGAGWYDAESNKDIPDPDWQNWRWTSKKAACELKNSRKEMLLILCGSVDKTVHDNQEVKITLNNTLLDEFIPGTAKFFKEYVITPAMMGDEASVPLIFATDKTFIPSDLNPGCDDNRELGVQIYYLFFGERV